jgi:hypothetical protein
MTFGVECGIDLVPHMANDDLLDADATLARPAGTGRKHPAHITAGIFERRDMVVERADEAEVVNHGGDVEQLPVVGNTTELAERRRPQVRALA